MYARHVQPTGAVDCQVTGSPHYTCSQNARRLARASEGYDAVVVAVGYVDVASKVVALQEQAWLGVDGYACRANWTGTDAGTEVQSVLPYRRGTCELAETQTVATELIEVVSLGVKPLNPVVSTEDSVAVGDQHPSFLVDRYADGALASKLAVVVSPAPEGRDGFAILRKLLDSAVARVGHVDVGFGVGADCLRAMELSLGRTGTGSATRIRASQAPEKVPITVDLDDAVIACVGNYQTARGVACQARRVGELHVALAA